MHKVALLYNPLSGGRRERRAADVETAASVLRAAGVETLVAPTRTAEETPAQVHEAIIQGCDTIFACGGDGTAHDVLQGLVGTSVALAVIPLGTANALACDLRVPFSPARAALAALAAQPKRIAVGRVEYRDLEGKCKARYFTVAAGVGVDAHLFYQLNAFVKGRIGMAAYYAKAWHLWMTYKMLRFSVEYAAPGEHFKPVVATELLAVRIRNFGGVLRELAPGASLERNDLRLVLCRTSSRVSYLLYVLRGLLGAKWKVPDVELAYSDRLRCTYLPVDHPSAPADQSNIYVEADGELLGTLPAEISIIPDAVTLLVPQRRS